MRLNEYHSLVAQHFGDAEGKWISYSHVLPVLGGTPDELIAAGTDPAAVWQELCVEFEVPESARWGVDYSVD